MTRYVAEMEAVIDYIENNLDGTLNLKVVAEAVHYSRYYLHHMFTDMTGITMHDYILRRRLTEAAKLLIFSNRPIIEIAFICGYESQQAFSSAFKAMYKIPPARYRENGSFYPLQLRFSLQRNITDRIFTKDDICYAEKVDLAAWMQLMRLVIDGYPVMNEPEYQHTITTCIEEKRALVLKDGRILAGAMAFSYESGSIDFLGIHPQYRRKGVHKLFLDVLLERYLPGKEISMTTYREGDKADTGYRDILKQSGFAERELLIEFGYPTQRFVHPPKYNKEEEQHYGQRN